MGRAVPCVLLLLIALAWWVFFGQGLGKVATEQDYLGRAWPTVVDGAIATGDRDTTPLENPTNAREFCDRGFFYNDVHEFDKAVADFTEALRLDPKLADAYYGRGVAWGSQGENDKAIADVSEALRLNPEFGLARVDRGRGYYSKGEYDKAIADFNEGMRLCPKDAFVYYRRGLAWGRKASTTRPWPTSTRPFGSTRKWPCRTTIGALPTTAWASTTRPSPIRPSVFGSSRTGQAYCDRGLTWRAKGEYDKAVADFTEAVRRDPQYAEAFYARGEVRDWIGEKAEAAEDFAEARRLGYRSSELDGIKDRPGD